MVCLDVQDLRDEYVRHFQNQDFVVGRKYEAQLSKTLLPRISAADLQKLADRFKPSSSCTVKAISHNRYAPQKYLTKIEVTVPEGANYTKRYKNRHQETAFSFFRCSDL